MWRDTLLQYQRWAIDGVAERYRLALFSLFRSYLCTRICFFHAGQVCRSVSAHAVQSRPSHHAFVLYLFRGLSVRDDVPRLRPGERGCRAGDAWGSWFDLGEGAGSA